MKLKILNYLINTRQPIRLWYLTGASNIATIDNFERYKDYDVVGLWCNNNELNIKLKEPEYEDLLYEDYKNQCVIIFEKLIKKYTLQIIELYCKEESPDNLEDVLSELGISSEVLNKYRNVADSASISN